MANFFKDHKEHLFILAGGVLLGIIGTNIYNNSQATVGFANVGGAMKVGTATNAMTVQACNQLIARYNQLKTQLNAQYPMDTTNPTAVSLCNQLNAVAAQINANKCGNYPQIVLPTPASLGGSTVGGGTTGGVIAGV